MDFRIYLNGILLYKSLGTFEIALALYSLNLGKQFAKQSAEFLEVVNLNECLAVFLYKLDNIVCLSVLVSPSM